MRISPLTYNFTLMSQYYELNTSRVNLKAYASIDEVTDKNASAATNPINASSTSSTTLSKKIDNETLLTLLSRLDTQFAILMHIDKPDLVLLLNLLDKDKLIIGLSMLSIPKLLNLLLGLPKDILVKALLLHMSQATLLSMMPQKELFRILNSFKIRENMIIDLIRNQPTHILIQLLESVLGESIGALNHNQVLKKLETLNKRQLLEGLLTLPSGSLLEITLYFTNKDQSLLTEMSRDALSRPFYGFSKFMLAQSFGVLENSEIIKIMSTLPKELVARVACMIDPNELLKVLTTNFPNLLAAIFG